MHEGIFSEEDADRINRDAVAIESWQPDPAQGAGWPVVFIDDRTRPDLADLGRVLVSENPQAGGNAQWLFVPAAGCAILICELSSPVVCRYNLVFDLPRCRPLLELVLSAGGLFIGPEGRGFGVSDARHRNLRDFLDGLP